MKTSKPSIRFWTLLGIINALAIVYPVQMALRADGRMDSFMATVVLIFVLFLLAIIDVISIVVAYSLGPGRERRRTPARRVARQQKGRVIPFPTEHRSQASNL